MSERMATKSYSVCTKGCEVLQLSALELKLKSALCVAAPSLPRTTVQPAALRFSAETARFPVSPAKTR